MNKKLVKLLCAVMISCTVLVGCNKEEKVEKPAPTADETKFKTEYEGYNNKDKESGKGKHIVMDVIANNHMKYSNYEEVTKVLDGGTGVIFFSFPTCPWCRNAAPVLAKAADEAGVKEILYYNCLDIRDKKKLGDDGKIITEKEGTKEYYTLVEKLKDVLPEYKGLNDPSIKRIYFPTIVFVKDGKVVEMLKGTVDSQKDASVPMNEEQTAELVKKYKDAFKKIGDGACGENC
ncbi:MAG: thioredoxin family protein [Erysipelotrichaceae bacterium]